MNAHNDETQLSELAKKHLNKLVSKDVCHSVIYTIIRLLYFVGNSTPSMKNVLISLLNILFIQPKVHSLHYVQQWVALLVNKY